MSRHPWLFGFLTPVQEQIALRIARGLSHKEIACELEITLRTQKRHEGDLRERLGLSHFDRTSAAVFVLTGWLPEGAACEVGPRRTGW